MKLKKRKIKYATIFFICWFALLVFLVDGVLKFQTLVDYFGSYVWVEVSLLLLVILPTLAVYKLTKERKIGIYMIESYHNTTDGLPDGGRRTLENCRKLM